MSRSRFTFLATFLMTLLVGAGLFYALPALAQGFGLDENFASMAGFSTELDIRLMIARLIRTVISFIGVVLVVLIVYGGFVWMTAAGSAERVDKAKKIITNAVIGMVIVIASFAITSFILGALTNAVGGGVSGTGDQPGPGPYPDTGSTSAFVLNSINTECASALKNLELQMIFSKTVKEDTVLAGGIRVRSAGGGPDVPGSFSVSLRKVTFVPDQICPEDAGERCFDPLSNYSVTLDPAILKSGGGTALTCNTQNPCSFAFTTGENIDVSGPSVDISAPEAGQSLMVNNVELLQAWTQDDTGVSSVEFTVDGEQIFEAGLVDSTAGALAPENYFQTDDTQWNTTGYVTNESYAIRARGYDCSGRSDSVTVTAILRSENCFNGLADVEFGEGDVDCGGDPNNEFYCGACVGDQCVTNEDCSSGVCENGFCVGATVIEQVSPGDGAAGNLVTISGRGFGEEPGRLTFLGADGPEDDFAYSSPYLCQGADTWTDSQIIIQLQPEVADGPILVETAALTSDYTNDTTGPYIPDFDVNDIVRPGLCSLSPPLSPANQEVRFLGNNFSAERGSSTAYFGTYAAASYTDWSANEFGAVVPLTSPGRYSAQVFVGDNVCSASGGQCAGDGDCPEGETCLIGRQGSNKINFQLLASETVAEPVINFIDTGWKSCVGGDPDLVNKHCVSDSDCGSGGECIETSYWGPPGQYVSIFGDNFGNSVGTVRFINNLGGSANNGIEALGSDDFAAACEDVIYWRDEFITIKVPEDYLNDAPLEVGSHSLYVKRQEGLTSNQVEFYVVDDQPGPAICALDPSAGPTGSDIDILGENFGSSGARAWFTPDAEAPGAQTDQTYSTQVPADAQTGNVYLANSTGYLSNQMPFTVGDCRDDADLCALGESCCGDGTCQLECPVTDVAGNYAYRFFTGPVPIAPEVVQICDSAGLGIVSPTPWEGHTRSQDICKNAVVSASFRVGTDLNPLMDQGSFAGNVLVEECLDPECNDRAAVAGGVIDTWNSGFTWLPAAPDGLATNTMHIVTLNGYFPEEDISAIQAADGEYLQDDFVWEFTTANSEVECSVGDLMVSPGEYTAVAQDEQVKYLAQPVAAGDGGQCILLNCQEYSDQYAWNSTDPVSAPLLEETKSACGISAEARVETIAGDFITVSSTIANPPASGNGLLTIHFTDPAIVSYWPNCAEACVNAEIGAGFNIDMDILYFSLDKCDTEACQNPTLIWQYAQWLDHDTHIHHVWPDDPLEPNTFYRATYYPNTESASGRLLEAVYGSNGFSWQFRTKDDPTFCAVDRVEVTPEQAKMTRIGDKQIFRATPYGAPDDCSANGQMLNASEYDWDPWQAEDAPNRVPDPAVEPDPVVVATLRDSGSLALSSDLEDGCSSDCRHTGSAIQAGIAVCGDGFVDPNAEDCDDGNLLPDDGCSPTCLFEGAFTCQNNSRCATDADCAGLGLADETCFDRNDSCGNGVLDTGEECDDGRQCANGVSCTDDQDCVDVGDGRCLVRAGDGCNARCLHEPGSALGYTCGNGDQASVNVAGGYIGEECDDNNSTNGDGCSSQCLNEGSVPESQVYSTCGNNLIESGEDCDDGNLTPGDGCSEWCLAEGTTACVSLCTNIPGQNCSTDADCGGLPGACQIASTPCCGNGAPAEVGETCDDGNAQNGDGCSSRCLLEGSSLDYGSVCGNGGLFETGEICEAVGPLISGPFAVAEVDEGAVEELLAAPEDVNLVSAEITGTVENTPSATVSGSANLSLACVAETDAQCGDSANYGAGTRGCCFARPSVVATLPADGSFNVCRNTALWFEFDQVMDPDSVSGGENYYLKIVNSDGSDIDSADCPAGYNYVTLSENRPWYARAWNWVKNFFGSFLGRPATAAVYQGCIVPNVAYSSELVGDGSRLRIVLGDLLSENTSYQIVALDDSDKDDGLALGLLSKYAVGLKSDHLVTFTVGNEICTLDEVVVEDLGKQPFDELNPSYELLTKSGEVHRLQGAGYAFRSGVPQEIQPISGVYDWEWSWESGYVDDPASCPVDNPDTPDIDENANCLDNADLNAVNIINETAPATNPTQADVVAQNQDGRENAYALASIITDQHCAGGPNVGQACADDADCPDSVCVPDQTEGALPLTVMLCSNPWPDNDFPFVQNTDNPGNGRGPTNFGFYYCRDAGEEDTTDDDLPALTIQEVATPAVGEIYREFLFIMQGTGEALGVRVMNNEGYLPPDMWYREMGFTGSPSPDELDGYEAVRDGNTIYALAANQTGDIFPNIYVLSTTDDPSPEAEAIFEEILDTWTFNANTDAVSNHNLCVDASYDFLTDPETGNFLPCTWDGDCPDPGICDAEKAKLIRDTKRLSDLVRIKKSIQGTCSTSNLRCSGDEDCLVGEICENLPIPSLSEGSFIRAMSVSRWPSWNAILGNSLGQALPEDPLNVFASCPGEPYDPESCYNATDGLFQCDLGSHIYSFVSSAEGAYVLTAQLEHDAAPWAFDLDPVLGDNADIMAEYENYSGSSTSPPPAGPVLDVPTAFTNLESVFYPLIIDLYNNQWLTSDPIMVQNSIYTAYYAYRDISYEVSYGAPYDSVAINGFLDIMETEMNFLEPFYNGLTLYPTLEPEFRGTDTAIGDMRASLSGGTPPSATGLNSGFQSPANFCSGSTYGDSSACGDGIKTPNEICEIGETDTLNCPGGQINANCINDAGVCRFQTVAEAEAAGGTCQVFGCGNGIIEPGEGCDDGALNGSYGYCSADCTTTPDYYCGDGYLAGGEQCDCGQNYSSLPSGSWAKSSGKCLVSNGQYSSDINRSCAFDCSTPGPACGDGLVNGGEDCDPGNPDENYQEESCGTLDGEGREEFRHRSCTGSCGWGSWSTCAALSTCGDGEINGTEECDDGNDNNFDACTSECKLNVCGDGFVNAGVESCDLGPQNGDACDAAYDSICYYCNESCQYQSRTGDFCGDDEINGPEVCDGIRFYPRAFNAENRDSASVCSTSQIGQVVLGNPRVDPPEEIYSCRYVGICNGGDHNGEPCTLRFENGVYEGDSSGTDGIGCVGAEFSGTCVAPKCASNCQLSCPTSFTKSSVLVQSGEPGATPQESISLYPFLNTENNIPDRASLFLPACRASVAITADIDKSDVQPPSVDVVFVTDRSGSMSWDGGWRLQAVKDATVTAIDELIDSYKYYTSELRIGLVSYEGANVTLDHDFSDNKETLKTVVEGYVTGGGTPTDRGLQSGIEMLKGVELYGGFTPITISDADVKILVLLTDGDPSVSHDIVVGVVRETSSAKKHPDVDVFTATLTTNPTDPLYGLMRHISNDDCLASNYSSHTYSNVDHCQPDGATEFAFQAADSSGVNIMYEAITDTVLGVAFAFVTDGPTITAGQAREGNDAILPFPENFACTGGSQTIPIRLDYSGSGQVHMTDFKFEYCPVD